jgi:hypothetical protein
VCMRMMMMMLHDGGTLQRQESNINRVQLLLQYSSRFRFFLSLLGRLFFFLYLAAIVLKQDCPCRYDQDKRLSNEFASNLHRLFLFQRSYLFDLVAGTPNCKARRNLMRRLTNTVQNVARRGRAIKFMFDAFRYWFGQCFHQQPS